MNKPQELHWQIVFNDNANYIIREADGSVSRDQNDWNKLCGVFYSLLNTRKDAAMIGWRYNLENDEIELSPYYHISKSRDMFPTLITAKRGELIDIKLNVDYVEKKYKWNIKTENNSVNHEMAFTHNKNFCSLINFYFGGNREAPQTVSAEIGLEIK
ncbi:MAG: hypothetical protein AAFZ15_10380 [Bacteroidota bacterium]